MAASAHGSMLETPALVGSALLCSALLTSQEVAAVAVSAVAAAVLLLLRLLHQSQVGETSPLALSLLLPQRTLQLLFLPLPQCCPRPCALRFVHGLPCSLPATKPLRPCRSQGPASRLQSLGSPQVDLSAAPPRLRLALPRSVRRLLCLRLDCVQLRSRSLFLETTWSALLRLTSAPTATPLSSCLV